MTELVLTTYDWVPGPPRGFVRDLRVRWALEEAGLAYRVATTPFRNRDAGHLVHQPFAQVPWLSDGDISIFESGAILLHLSELSDALMPKDPHGRAKVTEWLFAALNSVEMAVLPWFQVASSAKPGEDRERWDKFFKLRMERLEPVLAEREWLAGSFSVADILMADVLRLADRLGGLEQYPAVHAFVARATTRPAFQKAHADQLAHFAAAD